MKTLVVVPARFASTRYPGKPLVELTGSTGVSKTLVQRSWEAAMAAKVANRVVVATDDARISDVCQGFGAEVVMTSEACKNGTERCAEAVEKIGEDYDVIVNLQGDAPLTPPWFVDDLVHGLTENKDFQVATPVLQCNGKMRQSLIDDRMAGRVGGTTAVFDEKGRALYFSKEVIPYCGDDFLAETPTPVFHHVGLYAYTKIALKMYKTAQDCALERLEGLEQLRFIENGVTVRCVEVKSKGRKFWELNNPSDKAIIENIMIENGLE